MITSRLFSLTRRDFLNGTQVAIGGSLFSPWSDVFGSSPLGYELENSYYPPSKTGLRGSHKGSFESMHERVNGKHFKASSPEELYDLVVVGGGMPGLNKTLKREGYRAVQELQDI